MTVRPDGFLFELRDQVFMLVKWNSPKQLQVEMWQGTHFIAPDVGNIFAASFRAKLTKAAQAIFGGDAAPNIGEDIDNVAAALGAPQPSGGTLHDQLEETAGPSITDRLVHYARQGGTFFHDAEGETFATVEVNGHVETYTVKSRTFRRWLRGEFWRREKMKAEDEAAESEGALFEGGERGAIQLPAVVREQNLTDALGQLEALAYFEGREQEVYLRVASGPGEASDRIYIDLCDEDWRVVEISADGWQIVSGKDAPVRFVRPKGMAELPEPATEGSVEPLRALLNLGKAQEENERSFRLILAWLVQALRPQGPYPVLVLLGERGAAKSTAARILRSLVDPSTVPLRTLPRNPHDLYIDAVSSWTITFDNISSLPRWLSDALCMLATGGGFSTRTLFTDREQELFKAMRPAILNGITDVVAADDLVQRSLIVRLPTLAKGSFKTEREIQRELKAARPQILAALFDAAVEGLRRIDSVEVKALPRMGDFASWAVATEEALGGKKGSFMAALQVSDEEGAQQALEASPLAEPLFELTKDNPDGWEGTATELLIELKEYADEDLQHSKEWPKAANVLSSALRRLAPLFRESGQVRIQQLSRTDGRGTKRWSVGPLKDSL
jgi:hypothetical protein